MTTAILDPVDTLHEIERLNRANIREYEERIKKLTDREIERTWLQCQLCDGLGFSMFEDDCSGCEGYGRTRAWVYVDCQHDTEGSECLQEDCEEKARLAKVMAQTDHLDFPAQAPALRSLKDVQSERDEAA